MALIENKDCPVCESEQQFINGKCVACDSRKRRADLHKWNSMSYDARLTDLRKRMETLEAGPPRY